MLMRARAHWKAAVGIIAAVAMSAAVAFVISKQATSVYTADARLVVTAGLGRTDSGGDGVLEAPRLGQSYAVLATTRPVLLDVIERTGLPYDPANLASRLSVTGNVDSPFITISMTDEDPERAATTANALAEILVERATIPAGGSVPARFILAVVELANVPQEPSGPRVLFNTALAAAAAFVAMVAIVAGIAYLRNDPPAHQAVNR